MFTWNKVFKGDISKWKVISDGGMSNEINLRIAWNEIYKGDDTKLKVLNVTDSSRSKSSKKISREKSTKSCSQCATAKPRSGFSKTQWKKPAAVMRCLACVAAGPAAQTGPLSNSLKSNKSGRKKTPPKTHKKPNKRRRRRTKKKK